MQIEIEDAFGENWCVYGHYQENTCFYVGAGSICRAFNKHRKFHNPIWAAQVERGPVKVVIFHRTKTKEEAFVLERTMINIMQPSCNQVVHNKNLISRNKPLIKDIRPVRCVETGVIYKSCSDADKKLGFGKGTVHANVTGHTKSAKGQHFARIDWSEAGMSPPVARTRDRWIKPKPIHRIIDKMMKNGTAFVTECSKADRFESDKLLITTENDEVTCAKCLKMMKARLPQ